MIERPRRGSFYHRVYVDLVCALKMRESGSIVIRRVAEDRRQPKSLIRHIYKRYILPQYRAGIKTADLV